MRSAGPGCTARAPDTGLERAQALVHRAHLIATHGCGVARASFEVLVPGARDTPWLECELGVQIPDGSLDRPDLHGLDECRLGLWLLAQPFADSGRSMLAVLLDPHPDRSGPGPASVSGRRVRAVRIHRRKGR